LGTQIQVEKFFQKLDFEQVTFVSAKIFPSTKLRAQGEPALVVAF